jgi:hypothetical protein
LVERVVHLAQPTSLKPLRVRVQVALLVQMGVLLNLVVVVEVVLPQLPQRVLSREEVLFMERERVA